MTHIKETLVKLFNFKIDGKFVSIKFVLRHHHPPENKRIKAFKNFKT